MVTKMRFEATGGDLYEPPDGSSFEAALPEHERHPRRYSEHLAAGTLLGVE
jgi:hypothetical protein